MKSYHLTQEQVLEIWNKIPVHLTWAERAQDFANAVLDQVLGEPAAEVIGLCKDEKIHTLDWDYEHIKNLRVGTKLYAPKEQS